MNIFIDANVYLTFFETSTDSLLELEKLVAILKNNGNWKLWLPDQVKREFWKHRDGSIADALREFTKSSGLGAVPRLVKENSEFKSLAAISQQLEAKKQEIVDRVRKEVAAETTTADEWVRRLFNSAEEIDTSGDIYNKAQCRALRHVPPGKQESMGDRLSWIALLESLPTQADLHIVSNDSDYAGELEKDEIHPYLKFEWQKKKNGQVTLWKRISQFIAAKFPDAKNAVEIEQALLIQSLENSLSFATTHNIIPKFGDLANLNPALASKLANVILNTNQVYWIRQDRDVKEFIARFLGRYGETIAAESKAALESLIR